ncbi:MAG: cytidine deaminase, partial [Pseudomonadota bacterium]
ACAVRKNAYAPYSNYQVGAALITEKSPEIFTGCNVENASYGATICAERGAIMAAIAALGEMKISSLVLVTRDPAPPCGMCLQVISEFSTPGTQIILATPENIYSEKNFSEFLPHQFSPFDPKDTP